MTDKSWSTSNCMAGRALEYFIELCHSVNDIPARCNLRSSSHVQLVVHRYRKECSGRRGFFVFSSQLWNLLPTNIRLFHNQTSTLQKEIRTHSATVHVMPLRIYATSCDLYYSYYYPSRRHKCLHASIFEQSFSLIRYHRRQSSDCLGKLR